MKCPTKQRLVAKLNVYKSEGKDRRPVQKEVQDRKRGGIGDDEGGLMTRLDPNTAETPLGTLGNKLRTRGWRWHVSDCREEGTGTAQLLTRFPCIYSILRSFSVEQAVHDMP